MKQILALLLAVVGTPLWAEESSTLRYDVRLLGARVGVMTIAANETATAYAARSVFKTAGLVGALKHMTADVAVQGRVQSGALRPVNYQEAIDDGSRVTNAKVRFSPGPPTLVSGDVGSKAKPPSAASLRDAIDPLTVLYAALRDQPRAETCDFEADVFDGQRLAYLALNSATARGDAIVCNGIYKRVSGYTRKEREGRAVAISVDYEPVGEQMRAVRVRVETKYGQATMQRR